MADPWSEQYPGQVDPLAQFRALMQGAQGGSAALGSNAPPPAQQVAPQIGAQIPGGALPDVMNGGQVPGPVPPATPGAPPPFIPQLPQPDFSSVRQPKPLSTPQVQYYPTKGGARAAGILGALSGFREGAQHANDVESQRLANIGKMAYAQIQSISASGAPDAQQQIAAIVNKPEVQQGLRLMGIELPMVKGSQEANAPSGIRGVLGKVMSGVTGVPQRPATGQVDVNALPQMDPARQAAVKLQQTQLQNALYEEQIKAALPQEAKDLLVKAKLGLALSPADQAKLDALTDRAMEEIRLKHQNAVDLQKQKDAAAMERVKTKPQAEQTLDREQADLEVKVSTGKATDEDKVRLAAIKQARTQGQQTTYNLNAGSRGDARLDKSYQFNSGQLQTMAKPITDQAARLGRLQDSIAQQSPQADSLLAPELLTVMAGGQGSGLRMNEAEISRIVGGRSNWESMKAALNKWQLDPTKALSVTPAQRQQMVSLINTVADKVKAKQQILADAGQGLVDANDVKQHRQTVADTRSTLAAIDAGAIVQKNAKTGQYRISTDQGKTWRTLG